MMLTLDPGVAIEPGRSMVSEQNIVVADDGAELLSRRALQALLLIA